LRFQKQLRLFSYCLLHLPKELAPAHYSISLFETANQYTLQCDLFSNAILNNEPVPTPLEDAVNNMKIIEAVFERAKNQKL